jgi:hypothetical protein
MQQHLPTHLALCTLRPCLFIFSLTQVIAVCRHLLMQPVPAAHDVVEAVTEAVSTAGFQVSYPNLTE